MDACRMCNLEQSSDAIAVLKVYRDNEIFRLNLWSTALSAVLDALWFVGLHNCSLFIVIGDSRITFGEEALTTAFASAFYNRRRRSQNSLPLLKLEIENAEGILTAMSWQKVILPIAAACLYIDEESGRCTTTPPLYIAAPSQPPLPEVICKRPVRLLDPPPSLPSRMRQIAPLFTAPPSICSNPWALGSQLLMDPPQKLPSRMRKKAPAVRAPPSICGHCGCTVRRRPPPPPPPLPDDYGIDAVSEAATSLAGAGEPLLWIR